MTKETAKIYGRYVIFTLIWWVVIYFLFVGILLSSLVFGETFATGDGLILESFETMVTSFQVALCGVVGSFFWGTRKKVTVLNEEQKLQIPKYTNIYLNLGKYAAVIYGIMMIGVWFYAFSGMAGSDMNGLRITAVLNGIVPLVLAFGIHRRSILSAMMMVVTIVVGLYNRYQGAIHESLSMNFAFNGVLLVCFMFSLYAVICYKQAEGWFGTGTEDKK